MDGSFLSLFDPYDGFEENAFYDDNHTAQKLRNGKQMKCKKWNKNIKDINSSDSSDCSGSSASSGGSGSSGNSGDDENQLHSNVVIDFDQGMLPPEPQLGNIEYKLKLINPSQQRFEHLVTQMKWRLREGHGEAIYEIGVSDSGQLRGLIDRDMSASLDTLRRMAHKLGASTTVLRRKTVSSRRSVVEMLIRRIPEDQNNIEVRVGVLGKSQAGKSTLLGVLTQGELDNGRGSARLNMFRHRHEISSGFTSSISHESLGFTSQGDVINYKFNEMMTAEEISDRSTKLVTFMDLAGHKRYFKTTVQALTGYSPHHAMLVVASGSEDINSMTNEHLDLIQALEMPFFIVVTKIENAALDATLLKLKTILTSVGCRKVPLLVRTDDDVLTASSRQMSEQVVPIFCVSNVTGVGLDLVSRFLFVLSPGTTNAERERLEQQSCEFLVDEIFNITDVGPVVGGLLVKGVLTENMKMKIGPLQDGSFLPVAVQTIHRNKAPCRVVRAGQSASLSFAHDEHLACLRSGMILLPDTCGGHSAEEPFGSIFFQAKISVLFHATAIYEGFQTTVHIGNIRQTAVIEGIMGCTKIGTNEKASVLFRFLCHPEYVQTGMRILFREGKSKGIGEVTQVFPLNKQFD